jgi:riboflavin-specific deaminase-like protein
MEPTADAADWSALLALRDGAGAALPAGPLGALFGPALAPPAAPDGCRVIGRLAQTLDGRIATAGGSSQWIGGPGDILHTHRLRALCHAVVVGAGTVRHDNPRLTTREVPGPDPLRVVLDTDRKLSADYGIFQSGPPTLLVCAADAKGDNHHGQAEVLRLPRVAGGGLAIPPLLAALKVRGASRIFVEGGGLTVSRFRAVLIGCMSPWPRCCWVPAFPPSPCRKWRASPMGCALPGACMISRPTY